MLDMWRVQIESTFIEAEKNRLFLLISKYSYIFVQDDNDLGRSTLVNHENDIGQNKRAVIEAEIMKMLDMGVIRQSQSSWSSPVVTVPMKAVGFRFCIYYRKLNAATMKDSYPLSRIDDILETLITTAPSSQRSTRHPAIDRFRSKWLHRIKQEKY